jgi:hypothetical protein
MREEAVQMQVRPTGRAQRPVSPSRRLALTTPNNMDACVTHKTGQNAENNALVHPVCCAMPARLKQGNLHKEAHLRNFSLEKDHQLSTGTRHNQFVPQKHNNHN